MKRKGTREKEGCLLQSDGSRPRGVNQEIIIPLVTCCHVSKLIMIT